MVCRASGGAAERYIRLQSKGMGEKSRWRRRSSNNKLTISICTDQIVGISPLNRGFDTQKLMRRRTRPLSRGGNMRAESIARFPTTLSQKKALRKLPKGNKEVRGS